ncbi:MAG: MlaD family protein [Candidatus Binataceae bacterium]
MAKRISPTAIGLFVVGSFAVLVAAIVVIGSGSLFKKPLLFICMFQGDLSGLKVGAPVKAKGVQIGSVASIRLRLSPTEGKLKEDVSEFRLPVIIQLDRSQIMALGGTGEAVQKRGFDDIIKKGMRAQLRTESLLTRLLYIDLDLHPGTPLKLAIVPGSGQYREIPTVPTSLEAVQEQAAKALAKFDQIDFQAMAASITGAANAIHGLTGSPELKATLESLKDTTANLNRAAISIRTTVDNVNTKIDPLLANFKNSSEQANMTMKETQAALLELRATFDPDSPLTVHLNEALEQLTDTTRSVGQLTDYLRRSPAALVRGKYVPAKEQ